MTLHRNMIFYVYLLEGLFKSDVPLLLLFFRSEVNDSLQKLRKDDLQRVEKGDLLLLLMSKR